MADINLALTRGDTLVATFGPVKTKAADPANPGSTLSTDFDLTTAGIKLWFTAKAKMDDADSAAVMSATFGVTGGPGGITVNDPVSTAKNYLTVTIGPLSTASLASPTSLYYDVQLEESDGKRSTIAIGVIALSADVTRA